MLDSILLDESATMSLVGFIQTSMWLTVMYVIARGRKLRREKVVTFGLFGWSILYVLPFSIVVSLIITAMAASARVKNYVSKDNGLKKDLDGFFNSWTVKGVNANNPKK